MLQHEAPGVFILVLANALSRREIYQPLLAPLQTRFQMLQQHVKQASKDDLAHWPVDDLEVLKALLPMDLAQFPLAQNRTVGDWRLQFHPLRSLRPARNSAKPVVSLQQAFDPQAFHFNKPFLRKEYLWQGEIAAADVRILYNKFPFADFHGLMVVEAEQCKPQYLTEPDCLAMHAIYQMLATACSMGMAYNSLGAFASVNHQHWQTFMAEQTYPIEYDQWRHNGGEQPYPLKVERYDSLIQAWPAIDRLQRNNQAFNLFLRHGWVWLIERKRQGEYRHAAWSSGFAWSEVSGAIMIANQKDFKALEAQHIEQELQKLE